MLEELKKRVYEAYAAAKAWPCNVYLGKCKRD